MEEANSEIQTAQTSKAPTVDLSIPANDNQNREPLNIDQLRQSLEGLAISNEQLYRDESFTSDPQSLVHLFDICKDTTTHDSFDNLFDVFKMKKNSDSFYESFLIYPTNSYNINVYSFEQNKVIKEIVKPHSNYILTCKYFSYKGNDYILSSSYDKKIKVFDIKNNYNNLFTIENPHSGSFILASFIEDLNNKNKAFIISATGNEKIKIWDFNTKGKLLYSLNNSSSSYINFINSFYDKDSQKFYVITATNHGINVYDLESKELIRNFEQSGDGHNHLSAFMKKLDGSLKVVESARSGQAVRVWDFHTGQLVTKIAVNVWMRGICLWNERFLFGGGSNGGVKLFDLKEKKEIKEFKGHGGSVNCVRKIKLNKLGEALISHGSDGVLKIWGK